MQKYPKKTAPSDMNLMESESGNESKVVEEGVDTRIISAAVIVAVKPAVAVAATGWVDDRKEDDRKEDDSAAFAASKPASPPAAPPPLPPPA